jgi:hypothetical protein
MFGKRKQDRKHRFAEESLGDDALDDEARPDPEDPELAAALLQLGRNRHAPLVDPPPFDASESDALSELDPPSPLDASSGLDAPVGLDAPSDPVESLEPPDQEVPDVPDEDDIPNGWGRAAVPTAAMLAEPERGQPSPSSVGEGDAVAAMRRERAKVAALEAGLRQAQDEAQELRAQLKQLQAASKVTETVDGQAATARADELEESLRASQGRVEELTSELEALRAASGDVDAAAKTVLELQSTVSALTAELEQSRAEAAAAGAALERIEREAKDPDVSVAAAEARAEKLAAEIEKLRAEAASASAQVELSRRGSDQEMALRAALEKAQASHAQAEAVLAENRRLASDLAANLQSQEGLIFALTGLQTEVTEQRAWFEAQIAQLGQADNQQTGVIKALQAAVQERDIELQVLRQQLLEAEAKRAEEAAAFVAALESQ